MIKNEFTSEENMDRILEFIKKYIEEHLYPPTIREILDNTGFKSTSTVQMYVQKMIEKGMLETDAPCGTPRAIRVPGYEFKEKVKSE